EQKHFFIYSQQNDSQYNNQNIKRIGRAPNALVATVSPSVVRSLFSRCSVVVQSNTEQRLNNG
ncbi:MAG: hypothetical protein II509_02775, partial [Prevotella sp.]|nr:hypothetical protein [Prevotella sp.]